MTVILPLLWATEPLQVAGVVVTEAKVGEQSEVVAVENNLQVCSSILSHKASASKSKHPVPAVTLTKIDKEVEFSTNERLPAGLQVIGEVSHTGLTVAVTRY